MPANRFFIQSAFKSGSPLLLEGIEHHHLAHVMRLTQEEKIEIINGLGDIANAKILEVKKKETTVQILETTHHPQESPLLFLGLPLMRASKLEWVIEKGTELGANAFYIYTARGNISSYKHSVSSHLKAI